MATGDSAPRLLEIYEQDHVHGPAAAEFTLVEYGDYECPACGQLFETIQHLQGTLGQRLRIVYRHYPLSGIHPHALEAAEAAEAAGAQGRFWEMHELLFRNQTALKHTDLLGYAERLNMDVDRVDRELKEKIYEERVREDFRRGVQNGVSGTPCLFLNGVRRDVSSDHDSLVRELAG